MNRKLFLLIAFLLLHTSGEAIYAVNCGGDEYIDSSGTVWLKDQGYKGGLSINPGKNKYIKYTKDPSLYQTERHSSDNFTYYIPLPAPDKYVIILKFADFGESNLKKQFNIAFGTNVVIQALDIYENVKDSAAYDMFIPITISGETLIWYNTPLPDAVENGKIIINFIKTKSNPKVSGVMLFKGTLQETEYHEQEKRINHYKQLYQNKQELEEKEAPKQAEKETNTFKGEIFTGSHVISAYPITICLCTALFFIILQKILPKPNN